MLFMIYINYVNKDRKKEIKIILITPQLTHLLVGMHICGLEKKALEEESKLKIR